MTQYMGLMEAADFFNAGVPEGRRLSHQTIGNWIKQGYVRTEPDRGRPRPSVLDLVPCIIAQRAGKRWSGREVHRQGIERPAAFTAPSVVRKLHARMVEAGFPPVLVFDDEVTP